MRSSRKRLLISLFIFAIVMLLGALGDWSMSMRMAVAALFAITVDAIAAMVSES